MSSRAYETGSFSGTLPYSAPETFDDQTTKTYAIDIYSLGVILYEALEGQVPFRDSDPMRVIELHKNAPVPYPQKIAHKSNPDVVLALLRALAKNPIDRPNSAGKLIEELRRAATPAIKNNFWIGPGKQIGNYVIESSLGVGRLSQTFLARQNITDELVVVKLFSTGSTHADAIQSFKDEITALKSLRKPKGVLPLLDNGESGGMYYLVTKYMAEGSLRWYLDQRSTDTPIGFTIKEVINLFSQIAEAVDAIHQQGIIHRDLKPENIVLNRQDGMLKTYLTDFGIARVLAGTQSFYTQNVTGTFRYMAPEAWDPWVKKNAAVDIYAFGVMLYEFLEGHPPFTAEYPAIIQQHVLGEIPQPECTLKEYGPQAANVVLSALAKKAADRPKSAVAIIEDLRRSIPGIELIGERIASYRIVSFLGASAVGQTFKARDEQTGDWVAIKIMPYVSPIQELEIYQKLAPQRGILALRDSGHQDGKYYLVTDFADAGNLRQVLDQFSLETDPMVILDLFKPIASAIDRLHQMKIVHRDLKPENVVLRKTEHGLEPFITDFGISRAVSQTQSFYTSTVAGTSYYTAPEAWTPGARQTYAVDIYALGIMLYEALEGDLPFKAEYPAIGLQHLSAEVPYPKKIAAQAGPRAVKTLFRALAKKPIDRPETATEVVDQISQAYTLYKTNTLQRRVDHFFAGLRAGLPGRKKLALLGSVLLLAVIASTVWAALPKNTLFPIVTTSTPQVDTGLPNPTSIFPATSTSAPALPPKVTLSPTITLSPTVTLTRITLSPSVSPTKTRRVMVSTSTKSSSSGPGRLATAGSITGTTPQPAQTQAPATQAPATQAPATQVPATQPPATQPPATQAPQPTQPPPQPTTPPPPAPTKDTGKPPTKTPKP